MMGALKDGWWLLNIWITLRLNYLITDNHFKI
jgi:hypothetical protein